VKFGSNFQPFVRKRDVGHNDDEDMTREPEMVQAYRDTWELGLHSYLTYLRDRLLLARDLLTPSGSIFVQISDENLHHVRELMDEVFGSANFISQITFAKTTSASGQRLATVSDYLLWYGKDQERTKTHSLYLQRAGEGWVNYNYIRLPDGTHRRMSAEESANWTTVPVGSKIYRRDNLTSQRPAQGGDVTSYELGGRVYGPGKGTFKTDLAGLNRLAAASRLEAYGTTLAYRRFADDFPFLPLNNLWDDTLTGGYAEERFYVVQTIAKVIQRCMLMTSDPGDLVLDPTCGSGTTAYVAEQWGRRWITVDTSRVPLALARQRLLTATFPYYELKEEERGPAGGFVYKRKQNNKGEEVGGIVPHITLKSIANSEPPGEEVLVDRPEVKNSIVRVTGPFAFEATIPTPVDWEGDGVEDSGALSSEDYGSFVDRMLEVLRKSPLLRLEGNRTVQLKNIRPPAKSLSLSAEAMVDASADGQKPTLAEVVDEAEEKSGRRLALTQKPVAIVFGPENGAVSEKLVYEAAREAYGKDYTQLYVIGFAIQPNARDLIEKCQQVVGVPATYVQATPDLMMGDLLKNMRSSQIFSVCGLPEVKVSKVQSPKSSKVSYAPKGETQYQVELMGLDVFDPISMKLDHQKGGDVPAWFLDADYNGLCFHVSQAFFPRTGAWENLKRALKGTYEESVWDHLAGSVSAPFPAGEHGQVAVKVIDQRGNELLVVKSLKEVEE
jgi:adenine-specific DNA-methyltransferase